VLSVSSVFQLESFFAVEGDAGVAHIDVKVSTTPLSKSGEPAMRSLYATAEGVMEKLVAETKDAVTFVTPPVCT
jgi:GTP cyclohydrolase III